MSMKSKNAFREIRLHDFEQACIAIRPSVSKKTLMEYTMWHKSIGGA